mgnify:CR=1 FL=1
MENLPKEATETKKRNVFLNVLVILSIVVVLAAGVSAIFLWSQQKSDEKIFSSTIKAGEGTKKIFLSNDSGQEAASTESGIPQVARALEERTIIIVVSSGRIVDFDIKDSSTGDISARATAFETVTRDTNGSVKTLQIVVQICPVGSPETNTIPWFIDQVAFDMSITLPFKEGACATKEQLQAIFVSGTKWEVLPLLSFTDPLVASDPGMDEYLAYVKDYYNEGLKDVNNLVESGLTKEINKPLFIIGLNKYKEVLKK